MNGMTGVACMNAVPRGLDSPLLRPQAGGEGWVRRAFFHSRNVAYMRDAAPSPRTLSPEQSLGERGSDSHALRARQRYLIGAEAGARA